MPYKNFVSESIKPNVCECSQSFEVVGDEVICTEKYKIKLTLKQAQEYKASLEARKLSLQSIDHSSTLGIIEEDIIKLTAII